MSVTTLAYTGAVQTTVVPAGVTFVQIEWWGAQGGLGAASTGVGGKGGYSKGLLIVAPGTVLNHYVGGMGVNEIGGWNGGGTSPVLASLHGGGGGGASDTRKGGTALDNRVGVAGGGGGAASNYYGNGGDGGGAQGQDGSANYSPGGGGSGGGGAGGTQSTGYALGAGGPSNIAGPGGAGGGGYFGGYGVQAAYGYGQGGGGGSGYTGTLAAPVMQNGVRTGNGQIVITALNTAPNAPTLLGPPMNGYALASVTNTFTWQVNDPDPGDYQTRADFRYKKAGDSVWTTINNAATTVSTYTLPASTWTTGFQYEWQTSTYDNAGLQSPWSASSFVNVITTLTAPTIDSPPAGTAVYATPVQVQWTLPAGFSSDAYQIQRCANPDGTGVIYYDSLVVASTALTASVPLDATAGRTDQLRVRYRYFGHWSPWASSAINNQFGPPFAPLVYPVQTPGRPEVMVTITNPAAGGGYTDALVNDLIRTGPDGVVVRIAAGLPVNSTFVDLLAGAGTSEYQARAFAANGASALSPTGWFPATPSLYEDIYDDTY